MFKFTRILAIFSAVLLSQAAISADDSADTQIHYMGFNSFGADKAASGKAFDAYIVKLRPIMARYGVTGDPYSVVYGGKGELKADVVTFGTAKDQASFQAFFQDPELQAIFPMLIGALNDHQVVFTAHSFAPGPERAGANVLLSVNWLKGDTAEATMAVQALTEKASAIFSKYGVERLGKTVGVYSNRGLAAEIEDTVPPHLVELWAMKDAHGYFDDPVSLATEKEAKSLITRSESFWITERKIN